MWSDLSDAGTIERPLGVHEGAQEILAGANYLNVIVARCASCDDARIGYCTIYIHDFLGTLCLDFANPKVSLI